MSKSWKNPLKYLSRFLTGSQQRVSVTVQEPALIRGEKALLAGNYKEATKIFEEIVRDLPNLALGWNNVGVAYYQQWSATNDQRTLAKAQKAFEKAIEIDPEFADALNNLGNLLDDLGELPKAEAVLRKAIAADPAHADACSNLGMVLHKQEKLQEAVEYYKQAIRANPVHANAWCNLGEAYQEQGLFDQALKVTQRALEIRPDHPQARNNLERFDFSFDQKPEANRTPPEIQPDHPQVDNNDLNQSDVSPDLISLINVVNSTSDEGERRRGLVQIGQLGTKPAYDFLLTVCNDSSPLNAGVALHWVSEMNFDSRTFDVLIEKIGSENPIVRGFAAKALGNPEVYRSGEARRKGIASLVERVQHDDDDGVQMYALISLRQIKAKEAVRQLVEMLKTEANPQVYYELTVTINNLKSSG